MHSNELIEIVKQRRESLRVTQAALAELSGVAVRTVKQFESGKGNLTLLSLQKIGDALGLEITMKVKNRPGNK